MQQAFAAGHEVTAVVRRPAAIAFTHPHLRVVRGDVRQPASFAALLTGQDAVLSALGVTSLRSLFQPLTFYRQSARNLVEQAEQAGVRQFICLTSVGVASEPVGPWFYVWFIKPLLRYIYADMRHMEQVIWASRLAWTIVRPTRLVDGPHTGHYRVGAGGALAAANTISRADVADCMLRQLDTQANWHRAITVAY